MTQDSRERSSAEVLKDIIGNAQEMIRSEVRLAKAELKEEIGKTVDGAKLLGAGAGAGLFALGFVLVAVAQFLAEYMPGWAATLTVGVVLGVAAAVMIMSGKGKVKVPTPDKTIENVKENVEWVKNQTKS